jgi:hypothetical protein
MCRLVAVVLLIGALATRASADEPPAPPAPLQPLPPLAPLPPLKPPLERKPPVFWSVAAGLATAIVPLALGGGLLATADVDEDARKHAGIHIIVTGIALAPLVSHLVAREWKRAAIFSCIPIAMAALSIGLLESQGSILDEGAPPPRITFGAAVAIEVMGSLVGLIDSMMAGERHKPRPFVIVPTAGRNSAGISIGGFL